MDMKGGVVLGLFAVRLLRELGVESLPSVVFVGNPDEEIGSPTSRVTIEREASRADLVLVLEPGRDPGSIQTTRKGVGSSPATELRELQTVSFSFSFPFSRVTAIKMDGCFLPTQRGPMPTWMGTVIETPRTPD